jgi:hypothetical protein
MGHQLSIQRKRENDFRNRKKEFDKSIDAYWDQTMKLSDDDPRKRQYARRGFGPTQYKIEINYGESIFSEHV